MTKPRPTLVERCARALHERCGVAADAPLIVACSGGADSVALVHALAGRPLCVVFVDHGLRDVQAERDAAAAAARSVDARFIVKQLSGLAGRSNLQAEARAARYAALESVAAHDIAVGHTQTDRAETVLQRLVRGAGPHGLAAMPWRSGRVVRPLLDVSRAETRAAGHAFVDDPSNARDDYQRNRVRHDVLPLLARENPAIEATLAELADQLAGQRDLIQRLVTADLDCRGLELATIETYLRAKVAVPVRGEPLAAWARALRAGQARASFPLGGDLIGLARAGHASTRQVVDPRGRVAAWGPGTYRRGVMRMEIALAPMDAAPATVLTRLAPLAEAEVVWPLVLETRVDGSHRATHQVVDGVGRPLRNVETSPISEGIPARGGPTMAIHVGISNHPYGDVVAEDEGTLPLNG